ncbi:hypothetical protein B0H17DRAFT_1138140 [Mycena rosella]|uniref:BTB domain-containing protein n=1 Tax=Mycena rosella TaxID=1033263 RepID=A0AAD7DAK3_MYCRO|nr:hypothetical protein B0H17DRAFT_1138140 [Mycena rosella]
MAEPAAKRQRTENSPITRSDIWHDDGSVVLQAEGIQFRVHWTLLSLNSAFFRDMRGLPQPPDQPAIEGCSVIELPDSSTDLHHLLNALYDPLLFSSESLPFPFIAAIVRLGRKYEFKKLLAAAVERLAYENPPTLEAHDRVAPKGVGPYVTTRINHYDGILFDTVSLAQENNLHSILACAYSRAVLYRPESILDGIKIHTASPVVTLSPLNQRICLLGRMRILQAQWKQPYPWDWLSSDDSVMGCTNISGCNATKKQILRESLMTGKLMVLILCFTDRRLCPACEPRYVEEMAKGRKVLWDRVPSFFDLPPWSELKNEL